MMLAFCIHELCTIIALVLFGSSVLAWGAIIKAVLS